MGDETVTSRDRFIGLRTARLVAPDRARIVTMLPREPLAAFFVLIPQVACHCVEWCGIRVP